MKLIIFTYAPAGLGHLRVTEALVESRPKESPYILLGSVDRFMTWIHRFTSINPVGKYFFLKIQYGFLEDVFTRVYRSFLTLFSGSIYRQFKDIIVRSSSDDEVWIVATHFGMAHQIGAVKQKLIEETGRSVKLIVQVTDDTYQHIWCVRGADLTFVPSSFVKAKFQSYAQKENIEFVGEVIPYPISPVLCQKISGTQEPRSKALASQSGVVRVAIPISGAAVGLGYLTALVKEINKLSQRFEFWILVRKSPFTEMFRSSVAKQLGVNLLVGKDDMEMITLYEQLYQDQLIHLEITKPSEQLFKAILTPDLVGGCLLWLTSPVGRQERENLKFLERHGLLALSSPQPSTRAIRLPQSPDRAAKMMTQALESGLLENLTKNSYRFAEGSRWSNEVGADGTRQFWIKTAEKLDK
jgi:hypothetical protein